MQSSCYTAYFLISLDYEEEDDDLDEDGAEGEHEGKT